MVKGKGKVEKTGSENYRETDAFISQNGKRGNVI